MIRHLAGPVSPDVCRELAVLQARAYASIGIRPWSADEIGHMVSSLHVHVLIARGHSDILQGFLCLSLIDGEGEVLSLAVDPDHRRKRVASRLFEFLETDVEAPKAGRLVLEVGENNAGARALYRILGFSDLSTRRDYYRIGGNRIDAVVMERYAS